jgi:hypothetical protein
MSLQDRRSHRNSKQPELCKRIKRMLKDGAEFAAGQ